MIVQFGAAIVTREGLATFGDLLQLIPKRGGLYLLDEACPPTHT